MRCIFSWVNISDCHFGHGSTTYGHDQALVLEQLAADIKNEVAGGRLPAPDAVLVTGDIANSGAAQDATEYDQAAGWFSRLIAYLNLSTGDVLCVPGNHDIDRTVGDGDRHTYRVVDGSRRGAPIDDALGDLGERALLASRLDGYRNFVAQFGSPCLDEHGHATHWVHTRGVDGGFVVRLAGMNTALLCTGDDDLGHLQLGLHQIQGAFLPSPDPDTTVTIALTHHPFDWLSDGSDAEAWTSVHADIHLQGHTHVPSSSASRVGGRPEIIEITAGAAHGDEGVPAVHSYNFGAIFVDDDGSLIVRVWHRRWSGTGFIPDLDLADNKTEGFAEYRLKRKLQSNPVTSTTADVEMTASLQMLRAVGARRTAYPTDLTIAELDERNVLIAPRVTEYSQRSDKSDVASLVETLESGGSILVLGEPGAGKTVLVYLVHRGLLERVKAPLSVSITDLTSADELTAESLGEAASRRSTVGASVDVSRRDLVYLVDGIDEAVAAGDSLTDIVRVLEQLPQFGTVLATCRTREFEDHLIGRLTLDQFSQIAVLDEWSLEGEFREFVGRLVSARLLDDETVLALVRTTPALVELVRRPLFARMLTFVRSDEPSGIDDSASLYSAYLRHLARTVDLRLKRTNCEVPNSYSLWQAIAWHLFTKPQFHQELLPASAAGAYLTRSYGLPVRCAQTVVQGLLDFGQYGTELQARFRHYSFFEFLVADHLATALVDRAMRDQRECWDLLSLDLPREIRRHLTRVLTRSAPKPVIELLLWQFLQLEQSAPDVRTRRVVGNLSAYILGRIGASPRQLRHLLAREHDDFLRTALFWALANANDQEATLEYLALLLGNQDMASLNRGYLLYYWGDLDRDDEPPFRDDIEGSDWSQTRARTMGLMTASDYAEREGLARRTLDLVTFLDFVRFHQTVLTEDERRTIGERLTELGAAGDLATHATAFTREVLGSG